MSSRTSHATVTFAHPFSLKGFDGVGPAGTYIVRTEDELLEGVSFAAYGRKSTEISIPLHGAGGGSFQVITTDPQELELALAADRAKTVECDAVSEILPSSDPDLRRKLEISGAWSRPWQPFRFGRG